jgi:hypothetical protein
MAPQVGLEQSTEASTAEANPLNFRRNTAKIKGFRIFEERETVPQKSRKWGQIAVRQYKSSTFSSPIIRPCSPSAPQPVTSLPTTFSNSFSHR